MCTINTYCTNCNCFAIEEPGWNRSVQCMRIFYAAAVWTLVISSVATWFHWVVNFYIMALHPIRTTKSRLSKRLAPNGGDSLQFVSVIPYTMDSAICFQHQMEKELFVSVRAGILRITVYCYLEECGVLVNITYCLPMTRTRHCIGTFQYYIYSSPCSRPYWERNNTVQYCFDVQDHIGIMLESSFFCVVFYFAFRYNILLMYQAIEEYRAVTIWWIRLSNRQ